MPPRSSEDYLGLVPSKGSNDTASDLRTTTHQLMMAIYIGNLGRMSRSGTEMMGINLETWYQKPEYVLEHCCLKAVVAALKVIYTL